MNRLPGGTVTFFFSDVEGSTRLIQDHPEEAIRLLESHQRLTRDAIVANGGTVIRTEGDGFFAVFEDATRALRAAVEVQRRHHIHIWPAGVRMRVRIGLHTGVATHGGDDYLGIEVHRASRIGAAGHGGQIVLSDTTRALVGGELPEGVQLLDQGEHRLKDLGAPERLYSVAVAGLPLVDAPLRTVDSIQNNLPLPPTSFVDRDELAGLVSLLEEHRLVTLTGPGGTGKTRLAIEAARRVAHRFEGVFFVPLAAVDRADLVAGRIMTALEVAPSSRPPLERLISYLRSRHWLLVLDNFEQVLGAGPAVAEILGAAARISFLVTSRARLRVAGEREYPVPPLAVPDTAAIGDLDRLAQTPAVRLFVDRAQAVKPDFELDGYSAPAVAEVIRRLDGLPLAIELAAARVKMLPPRSLAARLTESLDLAGVRDGPSRHLTLRTAIGWSYDLLRPASRTVLRRLAVFRGGATLEAVESVCGEEAALAELENLTDHSLLTTTEPDGELRFEMLETIRDFAWEKLIENGEDAAETRDRHLAVFQDLAENTAPGLTTERQAARLRVLDRERDNLRGALEWAMETGRADDAARMVAALWRFWHMRGPLQEGRARAEEALAMEGASLRCRMMLHEAAGGIAYWEADLARAEHHYRAALELARKLADQPAIVEALYNLAFPIDIQGKLGEAAALRDEGFRMAEAAGDRLAMAKVQWGRGDSAYNHGDFVGARVHLERALEALGEHGDVFLIGWAHRMLGSTLLLLDDPEAARPHLESGLGLFGPAGDVSGIVLHLINFAKLALLEGDHDRTLTLMGAVRRAEEDSGLGLSAAFPDEIPDVRAATKCVGPERAGLLTDLGRRMSLDQAVAYALGGEPESGIRS